jgi:hypothetical protein
MSALPTCYVPLSDLACDYAVSSPYLGGKTADRCSVLEEKQDKMAIFLDKTNKKVSWLENTIIPEVRVCPAFADTSTSASVSALPCLFRRMRIRSLSLHLVTVLESNLSSEISAGGEV